MKNTPLLKMAPAEAREFLLKESSYCNFDLPEYFSFNKLLKGVDVVLNKKSINDFFHKNNPPKNHEDVNYIILNNKDGRYGWRPMELIHPALYVALVDLITEESSWKIICNRFKEFERPQINCLSIPVKSATAKADQAEQVLNWWAGVEQESIKLSTEYEHLIQIDLSDCYGSIYTHAIAWALHGKQAAKKNKDGHVYMLGNEIDKLIRHMRNGQTNGIPQGSVLMDFIAEMLLGYLDLEISKNIISKEKYRIIRYRDDYRIFVNDLSFGKQIVKIISECAEDAGLKLNSSKTHISENIVTDSIKRDKLDWLMSIKGDENLQKHLLLIHQHSHRHPNTGSIVHALTDFYKKILDKNKIEDAETQIAIAVDISFHNPKTYPITAAIISKLLSTIKSKKSKGQIIRKIKNKFSKIPNTGHMELWLQRVTYPLNPGLTYNEKLCKLD
uniref:RNA-directed DNA polymerase n=1 Tax=Flavobacterium sp. TaxID=239 RepID=UPI0037C16985